MRLPRVVEQFAAHGPAQRRGDHHRQRAEERTTSPVRDERDAADCQRVDDRGADRDTDLRAAEHDERRERVEQQRARVVDVEPDRLEADVQVPSSGRCWLKTSRARITKNASSPTGIHSRRIARTVATTIGTSASATQTTKHQNAVRSRVRVPGRSGSVCDIDTCSGAATRRTDEHRSRQTDLQHAGHAVACRLRYARIDTDGEEVLVDELRDVVEAVAFEIFDHARSEPFELGPVRGRARIDVGRPARTGGRSASARCRGPVATWTSVVAAPGSITW